MDISPLSACCSWGVGGACSTQREPLRNNPGSRDCLWGWEYSVLSFLSHQCPDSACKQDLLAYLQRIALYCHQLNICSKVKAEVQNLGGELVVSGVSVSNEAHWPVGVC